MKASQVIDKEAVNVRIQKDKHILKEASDTLRLVMTRYDIRVKDVAAKAGMHPNTLTDLRRNKGASLINAIKTLRAMQIDARLDLVAQIVFPEISLHQRKEIIEFINAKPGQDRH